MQKYISEARLLLALAIPVILAQIAQTAMGFVDTVMAGGYSATDMAAVAIGTSIWLPAILFGHGLLLALTPVIAQLNGSGRRERIAHQVRQGFWLAGFVSVLIMLVLWNAGYIIRSMENIDPALADKAVGYLRALLWGAPGYLFFQVARNQCEGLAKTKPGMVMGFIGLLVNIPVNYIFIYGHFGMPELGGVGCGVATAAVYWVMFLAMVSYIKRARSMRDIRNEKGTAKPDPAVMKRLIQLGLPIALALFFEVTLFAVVALLVSPLGIVDVAGHQIALNFSSLMFVLPMSLAAAVTIRVGYRLGQGSTLDAQTELNQSFHNRRIGLRGAFFVTNIAHRAGAFNVRNHGKEHDPIHRRSSHATTNSTELRHTEMTINKDIVNRNVHQQADKAHHHTRLGFCQTFTLVTGNLEEKIARRAP